MKCLVVTSICLIDRDHPSTFSSVGQLWTQSEHVLQPKQLLGYVYKLFKDNLAVLLPVRIDSSQLHTTQ